MEINEQQPASESSHSPTEQPGDASCFSGELTASDRDRFRDFVMLHMEMGMQSNPASFARHALEWATRYERAKQAERSEQAIESIRYRDDIIKNLEAKQDELVAENERQRDQMKNQDAILLSRMNEIYQQAETIKRLTEALESPLTFEQYCFLIGADPWHAAANTIWKTLELHGFVIVAKSALSGGSKQ